MDDELEPASVPVEVLPNKLPNTHPEHAYCTCIKYFLCNTRTTAVYFKLGLCTYTTCNNSASYLSPKQKCELFFYAHYGVRYTGLPLLLTLKTRDRPMNVYIKNVRH